MKISLALGPRRPLSRQTAWGCLTSNAALPGSGSLLAGRISGYPQIALAFVGLALSLVFGLRGGFWVLSNLLTVYGAEADPSAAFAQIWHALRWALLGILIFAGGWLWSILTSLAILNQAREAERRIPPKLN